MSFLSVGDVNINVNTWYDYTCKAQLLLSREDMSLV